MRDINDIQPEQPGQGFQFPGEFEIKAMGRAGAGLPARVPEILAGLGLEVIPGSLTERASSSGHYVSIGVRFACSTRDQYYAAHAALRADPDIHFTL